MAHSCPVCDGTSAVAESRHRAGLEHDDAEPLVVLVLLVQFARDELVGAA